jgi:hypothetical protein
MEWSDCSITQQGDINNDGNLSILDIVQIVNYILELIDFTDIQVDLADMNQDGAIDIVDLISLAEVILSTN